MVYMHKCSSLITFAAVRRHCLYIPQSTINCHHWKLLSSVLLIARKLISLLAVSDVAEWVALPLRNTSLQKGGKRDGNCWAWLLWLPATKFWVCFFFSLSKFAVYEIQAQVALGGEKGELFLWTSSALGNSSKGLNIFAPLAFSELNPCLNQACSRSWSSSCPLNRNKSI